MNTIIHLFIATDDKNYSQQAAHEAFKEIDILENHFSKYIPSSDISKINKLKEGEYTVVTEDTQECLIRAIEIFELTGGCFDVSLGASIDFWKKKENPETGQFDSGIESLIIDKTNYTVIVNKPIDIDLGGIGKGYVLEKIDELFKDWEIDTYLISLGNSSLKANCSKESIIDWPLTISNPCDGQIIQNISLRKGCLSSSGLSKGSHIIDRNTFKPVDNERISTWVYSDEGVQSDALSTAFMLMDEDKISELCEDQNLSCALLIMDGEKYRFIKYGDFFIQS
jgi:thiamine biosynthesis lipoprotein